MKLLISFFKKILFFFLVKAYFCLLRENIFLSVRKKSTENFVKRKLRPLSVSVMVQRIFSSWRLYDIFGGLWNLLYHSLKKSPFILSKDLLCFFDNQIKTWLFGFPKFKFVVLPWKPMYQVSLCQLRFFTTEYLLNTMVSLSPLSSGLYSSLSIQGMLVKQDLRRWWCFSF